MLMRVRKTWIKDDTPDLSQTLNALDKSLRDAQEWALSLRVLSAQDAHQNSDFKKQIKNMFRQDIRYDKSKT